MYLDLLRQADWKDYTIEMVEAWDSNRCMLKVWRNSQRLLVSLEYCDIEVGSKIMNEYRQFFEIYSMSRYDEFINLRRIVKYYESLLLCNVTDTYMDGIFVKLVTITGGCK